MAIIGVPVRSPLGWALTRRCHPLSIGVVDCLQQTRERPVLRGSERDREIAAHTFATIIPRRRSAHQSILPRITHSKELNSDKDRAFLSFRNGTGLCGNSTELPRFGISAGPRGIATNVRFPPKIACTLSTHSGHYQRSALRASSASRPNIKRSSASMQADISSRMAREALQ